MNETIGTRIERFLRTRVGDFETLAIDLFHYQFEKNKPYQQFCLGQDLSPDKVSRWQEIPAVPTRAFQTVELSTFPVGRAAAMFHSSATTGQQRSRHYLADMTFYETALKSEFKKVLVTVGKTIPYLVLTPAPGDAPNSSLSWMMDVVMRNFGGEGSEFFVRRGLLDDGRLVQRLAQAEASNQPVLMLGTTLSFLSLFQNLEKGNKRFQMAIGSRLMDTGGMKKDGRSLSRAAFRQKVQDLLGISIESQFNEYGMCELSSQFYCSGESSLYVGPPWIRTLALDVTTGQLLSQGQGLLRHFDLANVDSVMAVQTEDLGQVNNERFTLLGRAVGAELRGCSLEAPELRS